MDRAKTCCFTGHRPSRLPWHEQEDHPRCLALKADLANALSHAYAAGFRHFICGMAQGADFYFCEAALALRQLHPDLTVEAAIPYEEQMKYWPPADQQRWQTLLDQCDFETMVQHHYTPGCLSRRNRYMVDRSSLLIAVYDGQPQGGTFQTLTYALTHGLQTVILDIE